DYLSKPFELTELKQTISHALEKQNTTPATNTTPLIPPSPSTTTTPQLLANSPPFQKITHLIQRAATSTTPVHPPTELRHGLTPPSHSTTTTPQLVGNSPALQKITHLIQRVANSDSPVLLEGEFGVGKHLIAKVLHQSGNRKNSPFKAIQCSALSPELLDAEL